MGILKARIRNLFNSFWKPVTALLVAFIIGTIILLVAGYDPVMSFAALFEATFKSPKAFGATLNKASPLLFTGIAVAFAFRGNVFNIGAEGQFLFGAIAATGIGITFTSLPRFVLIPLMVIGGAAAGALWSFLPGYLKAKHEVSEVITTIMFNYIALQFVGYLVRGPFQDTAQAEPQSFPIAPQGHLAYIIPGTKLHIGFFVGAVMAVIIFILLFKTYFGYEVRAVGFNKMAAKTGGIAVDKTMISTMLISGALAGMGGAIELAGNTHYLLEAISPGYGFTAIAVSILAGNNPLGIILTSFIFGVLNAGSTSMQRVADVSAAFVNVFQGIIIIFMALAAVRGVSKKKVTKTLGTKEVER